MRRELALTQSRIKNRTSGWLRAERARSGRERGGRTRGEGSSCGRNTTGEARGRVGSRRGKIPEGGTGYRRRIPEGRLWVGYRGGAGRDTGGVGIPEGWGGAGRVCSG